jgi:ABC-2 type transport system ATP-binding protein
MSITTVIRTHQLTKRYKNLTAVRDLNLEVHRGEVFGFLGPNGAGKTTTISMLLGLVHPTAGSVEVLGYDIRYQASPALRQVGALAEPAFYPYLSARDNLWVMARMSGGGVSRERIDAVLEQVGLAARAGDRFRVFSTGMKQRLGLAAALLRDPDLFILDEPTSGLDPAGMVEIRHLLRHLAQDQGKTVFLASHLLHEVQQVCDRVLVLDKGWTLAVGRVDELLRQKSQIEIHVAEPERARRVLRGLDWVGEVLIREDVIYVDAPAERAADLNAALAGEGLFLHGLKVVAPSLEHIFLAMTGDRTGDRDA